MNKQVIRNFSLLVLVILLVTTFAVQVSAKIVFADLAPTHWCYDKIIDFEKKGYVCGYEDGTFRADQTITRAEYVKIVNNFFGYKQNTEDVAEFSDVKSGDWFAPYINEAVKRGYITGYDDGTFRPYDPIRRQEATVILSRILEIDKEEYPEDHVDGLIQYSDEEEVQDWARVAIHSYSVYNFINGYPDGTLRILRNVTRAETVELLHVLEQKIVIDRETSGGGVSTKTAKMPTIALWQEVETLDGVNRNSVELTNGWVNKANSTNRNNIDGVLVNITTTTTNATIKETLSGNKEDTREYITTETENLENASFLTDGKYKISATASKTGYKTSKPAEKEILVDTKAPEVLGKVTTPLADGTVVAHKHSVEITVTDPKTDDVNEVSGIDESTLKYAWFKEDKETLEYERVTDWETTTKNATIEISGDTTKYGTYKLGVSVKDVAGNSYGSLTDRIIVISGEIEIPEEIHYDFVEKIDPETPVDPEKPEDNDIIVIVGNNIPEVEPLVMSTKVGKAVSGDIVATDKDGDELTYTFGDDAATNPGNYTVTMSGENTTFVSNTAGTYKYNVKVSDGINEVNALVTVYVYDAKVITPSGDNGQGGKNDYDVTTEGIVMYVGETKELTAKLTPENANATYAWSESYEEISIDGKDNEEEVTIKGELPGDAKVKVNVTVSGETIEKVIKVKVISKITIQLPSYEKVYDGKALKANEEYKKAGADKETVTGTVREGDKISLEVSGEITNSGEIAVTLSGDVKVIDEATAKDRTEYYDITVVDGKLTVKEKAVTYKVEYYQQNISGDNYTLKETTGDIEVKLNGTTTKTAEYDANKYEGFTFEKVEPNDLTIPVIDDFTVKVYYTRNSYNLKLVAGNSISKVTAKEESGEKINIECKYEEEIKIDATLANINGFKYTFTNWMSGDNVYSTVQNATVTMPAHDLTLTAMASSEQIPAPRLAISSKFVDIDGEDISEYIYNPSEDNIVYYVIKLENTVKNSYPEKVVSATVTDTLPAYLEYISGDPSGDIIYEESKNKLTWNAKDIGYDEDAQYAYIKVRITENAFKSKEETSSSANVVSNITLGDVSSIDYKHDLDSTKQKTALFMRFAGSAKTWEDYLYVGECKSKTSETPRKKIIQGYDSDKIDKILASKDSGALNTMLKAFSDNQSVITSDFESLPSMDAIRKFVKEKYKIEIPENYVILWYYSTNITDHKVVRTYPISITTNGKTVTTNCTVTIPANSYHIDGILVDITTLNFVPEGTLVTVSNTANVAEPTLSATATLNLYYNSEPTTETQTLSLLEDFEIPVVDNVEENVSGEIVDNVPTISGDKNKIASGENTEMNLSNSGDNTSESILENSGDKNKLETNSGDTTNVNSGDNIKEEEILENEENTNLNNEENEEKNKEPEKIEPPKNGEDVKKQEDDEDDNKETKKPDDEENESNKEEGENDGEEEINE